MINKSTLRACRDRNGEPADNRPVWVDSRFSPNEVLGYHEGKPIAADSYDSYPESGEELLNPSSRGFLENVFRHRLVESYGDAAKEVPNGSVNQMENLSELHKIDAESLFEEGETVVETDDTPDGHIQVGEDEYVPLDWFRSVPWEAVICSTRSLQNRECR